MPDPRFTNKRKPEGEDDWMGTFADMMSLLLAFFIMLAAISKVDPVLYEKVKTGLAEDIGKQSNVEKPIEDLQAYMKETMQAMGLAEAVGMGTDQEGLVLEFPSALFFRSGSAEINEQAKPVLKEVADIINSDIYKNYQIAVEGHTDDSPISTIQFPSNWELSAARASAAVRVFIDSGVAPLRLTATGFADVAPKVANRDPQGRVIQVNQAINRRILVRIHPR